MKLSEIFESSNNEIERLKQEIAELDFEYNNLIKRNDLWAGAFGVPLHDDQEMQRRTQAYYTKRQRILNDLRYKYSMNLLS